MTPAEQARQIDRKEFEAECKAVRQRALAYAKDCRRQRRQQFLDWLKATADDSTASERIDANRVAIKQSMAVHFGKRVKLYTYNGEAKSLSEWSNIIGVRYQTLLERVRSGMDIEQALTMKPGSHAKRHTVDGITKTLPEWADHIGISYSALMRRLQTRTLAEALAMPAGRWGQTLPGVSSNLEGQMGTGPGSTAQDIPEITFAKQADNA